MANSCSKQIFINEMNKIFQVNYLKIKVIHLFITEVGFIFYYLEKFRNHTKKIQQFTRI